jgi:membrane protease subunit HflK
VRRRGPPSEIGRLVAPVVGLVDAAWQRMHWWIATMAVLYVVSGITIVRSDETAVVLRWGRVLGDTPALQQHGPGLLFALPRPIDQVVRVQAKHVSEVRVTALAPQGDFTPEDEQEATAGATLDPLTQGYALTGDQNIVHLEMVARYRVRDPVAWAFYGPTSETALRVETTAAMVRSLGEMGVDAVLSDGRKRLIAIATRRAQAGLDAARSGLELSSLELTRLAPPVALTYDFAAVQSAFIQAETKKKEAQAFAEGAVPRATATVDAQLQAARAATASDLATASGEAEAFRALDREYRASPAVVLERLYRDGVERALLETTVRWLPPPVGGSYHGMRITVGPRGTSPASSGEREPNDQ